MNDLDGLTLAELKQRAKALGMKNINKMRKSELIASLQDNNSDLVKETALEEKELLQEVEETSGEVQEISKDVRETSLNEEFEASNNEQVESLSTCSLLLASNFFK